MEEVEERNEFFARRCNEGSLLYRSFGGGERLNKRWKRLLWYKKP